MIDRVQMKRNAREAMRGKNPSIYLVTFVYFLIVEVLSMLSVTMQLKDMDIESIMDAVMAGQEIFVEQLGFWGSLILLAVSLMSTVIGAGYRWYTLLISRNIKAGVGEIFDAFGIFFKIIWLNIVMGIFIYLWSMLFIIPGIVAAYRYSFAIYILLDDPDKGIMQCIRESKAMTYGYKWELFVLDLSFIGWNLLTIIPFVSIFVSPYTFVTLANYYNELSGWRPEAQPVYEAEYKEPWEQ